MTRSAARPMNHSRAVSKEPLIWGVFLVLAAETALPAVPVGFLRPEAPDVHPWGGITSRSAPAKLIGRFQAHGPLSRQARLGSHKVPAQDAAHFFQPSAPHPVRAEHPLHNPERMFHPCPHSGLRCLRQRSRDAHGRPEHDARVGTEEYPRRPHVARTLRAEAPRWHPRPGGNRGELLEPARPATQRLNLQTRFAALDRDPVAGRPNRSRTIRKSKAQGSRFFEPTAQKRHEIVGSPPVETGESLPLARAASGRWQVILP